SSGGAPSHLSQRGVVASCAGALSSSIHNDADGDSPARLKGSAPRSERLSRRTFPIAAAVVSPGGVKHGSSQRNPSSNLRDARSRRMEAVADQSTDTGLSQVEATQRLRQDGPNELARRRGGGFLQTAINVLREPMILLLLAAGLVYVVLGDHAEAV